MAKRNKLNLDELLSKIDIEYIKNINKKKKPKSKNNVDNKTMIDEWLKNNPK
jgi:hypothetical protein